MSHFKNFFSTPIKAVVTSVCTLAVLAVIGTGSAYAAGAIAEKRSIGAEKAQSVAMADAGVDPAAARTEHAEFEFERGQFVYDIEFSANGTDYEYLIKASDGTVLQKEAERLPAKTESAAVSVSAEEAKTIALADAGLLPSAVTFTEVKAGREDRIPVYEISFHTDTEKFEYEINAETGAVYSRSREIFLPAERPAATAKPTDPTKPAAPAAMITADAAKSAALADAGLSAGEVTFTKAERDRDDGILQYDIEFRTAEWKYEYEIHAGTGAVLSREKEAIHAPKDRPAVKPTAAPKPPASFGRSDKTSAAAQGIGLERAKAIAAARAGLDLSAVRFSEAECDREDGRVIYEMEFHCGGNEYECTVDASSGEILEYECDKEDHDEDYDDDHDEDHDEDHDDD